MPLKSKKSVIEELDNYSTIFSDMYKEVYGHRPRFGQEDWTVDDYKQKIGVLSGMIQEKAQEEQRSNLIEFKRKLRDVMSRKECNWKKAIDSMMGDTKDIEYFLNVQGISPEKIDEIQMKYFNIK